MAEGSDAESQDSRASAVQVWNVDPEQGSLRPATEGPSLPVFSIPRLAEKEEQHTTPYILRLYTFQDRLREH